MAKLVSKLMLVALPLMLGGCMSTLIAATGELEDLSFRKLLGHEDPPPPAAEAPLYCYETLAREECYAAPIYGAEARLQGYVGPMPPQQGMR